MRRGPSRRRLGLMAVVAGLSVLFLWDSVHGQTFRGRGPGMQRPPFGGSNIGGGATGGGGIGGGGFEFVYTCTKCGKEVGRGKTMLDGPASCRFCGVRFINGGLGGGPPAQPPAGGNPAIPPSNSNPPPQNPTPYVPPQQPAAPDQPPTDPTMPQAPAAQAPLSGDATSTSTSATVAAPSGGSRWLIPGIVAIVVLGLLGVGGVWMMIAAMNKAEDAPRRSKTRSRRRRDDDDDD